MVALPEEFPAEENSTYKFKADGVSDHAIYFTIVGKPKPIWFFVNSKEMESFQWVVALMASYSTQLKLGADIRNIIEDMKESAQPNGSYMSKEFGLVHSILNHLGLLLEKHLDNIGK